MSGRKSIYLAGALFTLAEREFNSEFASLVRERLTNWEIILPQEQAAEVFADESIAEHDKFSEIYGFCVNMVDECDCVVAILDGPDADSGTCIEIGRARAKEKHIIGVRTDLRASEEEGLNLMVVRSCDVLIRRPKASIAELADEVADQIQARE